MLILIALAAAAVTCTSPRVIDGDTIVCAGVHVRLAGMDAPEVAHHAGEVSEPMGDAASARMTRLTEGESVTCTPADNGRDRYGRLVAICATARVEDLGRVLVAEGLARDWPRYSHGRYAAPELRARRAHLGLWRLEDTGSARWRHR